VRILDYGRDQCFLPSSTTVGAGNSATLCLCGAQNSAAGCDLGFLVRRIDTDRKRQDAGSWLYNWSI
jgi:hypothetical protein